MPRFQITPPARTSATKPYKKNASSRQKAIEAYNVPASAPTTSNVAQALRHTHEVFLWAAAAIETPRNVWMSCNTLRHDFRDTFTSQLTGHTLGEDVRLVLEAGGNVQILLWKDFATDQPLSHSLRQVMFESATGCNRALRGSLSICATGNLPAPLTNGVMHFVAASDDTKWCLRVEGAHGDEITKNLQPHAHVEELFLKENDSLAKQYGPEFVKQFKEIFSAVESRAKKHIPDGMYYLPEEPQLKDPSELVTTHE